MSDVAILGSGPAGLLTAYAAELEGQSFDILSIPRRSLLPGAMYLHKAIPGLTSAVPDGVIDFIKSGTRAGYAAKVYGSPDAPTSWDQFPVGERPAWSLSDAYDRLWERYGSAVENCAVTPEALVEIIESYKLVISTIPGPSLCDNREHEFRSAHIYVIDMAEHGLGDNTIHYNGQPGMHWYRSANVFGWPCTESTSPMAGSAEGEKPLDHDCDCFPEVLRLGRYGEWHKGILSHHVFEKAVEVFRDL